MSEWETNNSGVTVKEATKYQTRHSECGWQCMAGADSGSLAVGAGFIHTACSGFRDPFSGRLPSSV